MNTEVAELQRLWVKAQSELTDEGSAKILCDLMFPLFSKSCTSSTSVAYRLTFGDGKGLASVVCRTYSKMVDPNAGPKGVHTVMSSQRYAVLLSYLSTILEPEYYRAASGGDQKRVDAILSETRIHILRHDIFQIMLTLHNVCLEIVNNQSFAISEAAVAAEQTHLALFKCVLGLSDGKFVAEVVSFRCFQSISSTLTICYRYPFRGSSSLTKMAVDAIEAILCNEYAAPVLASEAVLMSEEQNIISCLQDEARGGVVAFSEHHDPVVIGQKLSTQSHCIHAIRQLRDASHSSLPLRFDIIVEAFLSLQFVMGLQKSLVESMFDEYLRFAFTNVTVVVPKKKEKGIGKVFGLSKKIAAMVFTKEDDVHEETRFEPDCFYKAIEFIRKAVSPEARLWFCSRLCECLTRVGTPGGPDPKSASLILYDLCGPAVSSGPEMLKKVLCTIDHIATKDQGVELVDVFSSLAKYLEAAEPAQQELIVRFFTTLASGNNQQLLQRTGEYSIVVASCKVINSMSSAVDSLNDASIDVAECIFCLWKILLVTDAFVVDFVKGMSLPNLVKCTLAKSLRPNSVKFVVASRNALVSLVQQRRKESVSFLLDPLRGLHIWGQDTTAHAVNLALAIYGGHCHEETIAQNGIEVVLSLIVLANTSTHKAFNLHVISFILSMLMPLVRWSDVPDTFAASVPPSLVNTPEMIRFILVVGCGLGVQSQILSFMLDACYSDLSDPSIQAVLCIEESSPQTQLCELEALVRLLTDWYLETPTPELLAAITWMAKAHRSPLVDAVFCKTVIRNQWHDLMHCVGNFESLMDADNLREGCEIETWYSLTRAVPSRHALTFLGSGGGGAHGRMELPSPSWPPMNGTAVSGWFLCSHDGIDSSSSSTFANCVPLWRLRWHYGNEGEHSMSLFYDILGQTLVLKKEAQTTESLAVPFRMSDQWSHICIVLHRWQNDAAVYVNGLLVARKALEYPVVIKEGGVLATNRLEVTLGFPQSIGGRKHVSTAQSLSMIGFQLFEGPLVAEHVNNLVSAPFHVRDASALASTGATSLSLTAPVLTDPHLRRLANIDLGTTVRQAAANNGSVRVRVPDVPVLLSIHPTVTSRAASNRSGVTQSPSPFSVCICLPNMLGVPCNMLLHGRYSRPPVSSGSPIGVFLAHRGPSQWLEWLENSESLGRRKVLVLLELISDCTSEGIEVTELLERDHFYSMASIFSQKIRFFTDETGATEPEKGVLGQFCNLTVKRAGKHRVVVNGPLTEMLLLNWSFMSRLREQAADELLTTLLDSLNPSNPYYRLNAWRLRRLGFVEGFVCGLVRYYVTPRVMGLVGDTITRFLQALNWDQGALAEVATFLVSTIPRTKDYSLHLSKLSSTLSPNFLFHIEVVRNVVLDSVLRATTSAANASYDLSAALPPSWFPLMASEESHPVSVAISMSIFATLYNSFASFRTRCLKGPAIKAMYGALSRHAAQEDVMGVVADLVVNNTRDVIIENSSIATESTRGQHIHAVFIPLLLHLVKCCGLMLRPSASDAVNVVTSDYMRRFSKHERVTARTHRLRALAVSALCFSRICRSGTAASPSTSTLVSIDTLNNNRKQQCSDLIVRTLKFIARLIEEHESIPRLFLAKEGSLVALEAVSWSVIASIGGTDMCSTSTNDQGDAATDDYTDATDSVTHPRSRETSQFTPATEGIAPKFPEVLLASLEIYNALLSSTLSAYDVHTSNTFSVKTSEVVYWLHTILCSHPPGIGDKAKGWFQSKVIDSWMSTALATTKRITDSNTSNRCKNCHLIGLYALERLVAGFGVTPKLLSVFFKGLKNFTSNSEIVKSIEIAQFDLVSYVVTERHHGWNSSKISQSLVILREHRDILSRPVQATNADAARSMYKNLIEITMYVVAQRLDEDLAVLTNDEIIIVDLWSLILIENRSVVAPLLVDQQGKSRIDLMTGGFGRAEVCRSSAEKLAFIMWLRTNASKINTFVHSTGGAAIGDHKFILCSPKRVQGWSQRSEDEIHTERGQHQVRVYEAAKSIDGLWSSSLLSGGSIDISLLEVGKDRLYPLKPFLVRVGTSGWADSSGPSPTFLNIGGKPSIASSCKAFLHLMQHGAVPLGALVSHSGDGTTTLSAIEQMSESSNGPLFKQCTQRVIEKILEGNHSEVRGAPVLWAGNVYHVVGNESLICTMFVTSYEVVIVSSSQLTNDGALFVASLETHEANKTTQRKGAIVENVIRRLLPKAPIPSSLSSSSLSTFRHSQYFRQLRTEAKSVQKDSNVWRFPLAALSTAHHRHFQHEPAAVEFVLEDACRLFVVVLDKELVMSRDARKHLVDIIAAQAPHVEVDTNTAKRARAAIAQRRWAKRQLSNFDYLMIINDAASRTFGDLTQYPVMPWVLSCYNELFVDLEHERYFRDLSWPLGALDENRRKEVVKRYSEWLDDATPPFHYGTHYSTSAIVMYFLVRLQPLTNYAMAYQGGRLDVADRLFHSVEEAWASCSSFTGRDVKELIPEFYSLQHFLVNSSGIDLGTRRDGVTLGDVQLPFWATSTAAFINTNREALESDRVGSAIHQWIDLIFGFKQEGEAAVSACNVFHHLTYAGGFEEAMTSAASEEDRKAIVASVDNFGLTPKSVFKTPHPRRNVLHPFRSHNDYFVDSISQLQLKLAVGQMCDVHCSGLPIRNIVEFEGALLVSTFNRRTTSVKPLQQFVLDVTRNLILNYRTKDQCTTTLPDIGPFGIGSISSFDFMPSGNSVFVGTTRGSIVVFSRSSWTSRHTIAHIVHTEAAGPISLLTYLGDGRLIVGGGSFTALLHTTRRGCTIQWSCRVHRQSMGDSSPVIGAALTQDALDAVLIIKERSIYVVVGGAVATSAHINASCPGMSTFTSIGFFRFSSASSSATFCCGHSDGRISFWSLSSNFKPKVSPDDRDDYSITHLSSRQVDVQGDSSAITSVLPQPQTFSLIAGCRSGALWSMSLGQGIVESFYGDV